MEFEKLQTLSREDRLAFYARMNKRNARDAPAPPPDSPFKTAIKLRNAIAKEHYIMKTTVSNKADYADISTASVSAAKQLEAIRLTVKQGKDAIVAKYKPTLDLLDPRDLRTKAKIDDAIKKETETLLAETAEARKKIMDDLKTAKKLADEYSDHLGDPRIVSSMYSIMSPERQRANMDLASAGPAVIKSASVQAKMMLADPKTAHEGKVLAAAVLARNQELDKAYRVIKDPSAYAAEMFATEISDVANWTLGISRSLAQAMAADREITGVGTNPMERVKLGLKFKDERIVPNDIDAEASTDSTPTERISAGLAALNAS